MLRHESEIDGYAIHASDGLIGTVSDFLFDDATWLVRWLVVDTGNWLPGRRVLLPPRALADVNHMGRQFSVRLTKQQVKECPDIESDRPVSRQSEASIYDYYGWSPYWGAGSYMGMVGYGGGYLPGAAPPSPELMQREKAIDDAQRNRDDPALRSANEVTGYHILASDGEIGHVADFLVEDDDWSIHYLVVDTKNWWPGRKVLISPMSVRKIEWAERRVNLGAGRQKVKDSPAYDPSMTIDPLYEKNFHEHYGDLRLREAS
ncbi:MAG: PRC-barrel domain-containing protein [Rhizomicrobium sp.]